MPDSRPAAQPRRGRPRRGDVDQQVLDASVRLIGVQGYSATTVDQIAVAAGVAKTTVYRRWRSKGSLAVAALAGALGEPPVPGAGREESLRAALAWLAGRVSDREVHQLMAGLVAEAAHDVVLRRELRGRIRDPFRDRAVEQWAVSPARVDLAFDVAVGSLLHHGSMAEPGDPTSSILELVVEVAHRLLFADEPPGRPGQ